MQNNMQVILQYRLFLPFIFWQAKVQKNNYISGGQFSLFTYVLLRGKEVFLLLYLWLVNSLPMKATHNQGVSNRGELWSKFPFLADKVEMADNSNRDWSKYDIYIIWRISQLNSYKWFPFEKHSMLIMTEILDATIQSLLEGRIISHLSSISK